MASDNIIGFFFFGCVVASILIFVFTKSRTNYYRDVELRILATKDPFLNNLYALVLFSLFGYLVVDAFLIIADGYWFGRRVMSLVIFEYYFDNSKVWFYLLSELMPIMWLYWAFNKEVKIIKKLRNARTLLLLGELPSEEELRISTPFPSVIESDKPATFAEVLQAMDSELKKAHQAAETLKVELGETKLKVANLEVEVQEKDSEIRQIKDSKSQFNKMVKDTSGFDKAIGEKSLSLNDSVMMGDSVMGGVKIDKQINNDPVAIARAVIDAYRMGKSDSD